MENLMQDATGFVAEYRKSLFRYNQDGGDLVLKNDLEKSSLRREKM